MDGSVPDTLYMDERRRRLAAERTLEHTRRELSRAHSALVANADRLSRGYLSEREHNLRLTERQQAVLQQRKDAADCAERARRRLWHALEAMRDGFAVFNPTGHLIAANHVYLDLFDGSSSIAPGCHATDVFRHAAEEGAFDIGDLSPETWAAQQVARWDGEAIEPLILHHFDGRVLRFQDRRAPDGDVVSLALDITETREREESLAAARDAAELTARAKADFLARMSHEIRTPMNGVIGLSHMLAEQAGDEETSLYARTIHNSAEALLVIVNDTLDVSKLEAEKIDIRDAPLDLEALLIDCTRLAGATARTGVEVGLEYPLDARATFTGDEGRIRQIVMNVLGNALKFTDEGHVVTRVDVRGDEVAISVEDTGIGIPADKIDAVFDAFCQVDDVARPAREGTGLGLTISRGLAERMSGSLTLRSEVGLGTTFELTLPLRPHGKTAELIPDWPACVTVAGPGTTRGDLVTERLRLAGCTVTRTADAQSSVVVVPLSLPHGEQRAILDAVSPTSRLVLLGRHEEALPDLEARAAATLTVPVVGRLLIGSIVAPAFGPSLPEEIIAEASDLPRVLLADDNATNRLLLDRMLRDAPYDVEIVADGRLAVQAYERTRPDAVVLDISMPNMDGFDAAQTMHAIERSGGGRVAPLLALTAHVGDDMAAQLRDAGFKAHLTKPLKKDVLLNALETALAQARLVPSVS